MRSLTNIWTPSKRRTMSSMLKHLRGTSARPMDKRLIIRGQLGDNSSYDYHSRIIVDGMLERGWDLCVVPYNSDA